MISGKPHYCFLGGESRRDATPCSWVSSDMAGSYYGGRWATTAVY